MKTIECFLQGKKIDDRLNEDGLFLSEHLVAVIDGVSMGTRNIWHGDTGGLFAKNVLMNFEFPGGGDGKKRRDSPEAGGRGSYPDSHGGSRRTGGRIRIGRE